MNELSQSNPVVVATGLGKTYAGKGNKVVALDGISLQVNAGEFVAVCGPSGCGKSTLLLILGLLLKQDEGSIQLSGTDVSGLTESRKSSFRAEHLGFVFQDFHLIPYLSVIDNILVPSLAQPVENATDRARMLLSEMGLENRCDHLPSALSAGERQRTALVRALLLQPELILADEPTGNLDRENSTVVLDHLSGYTDRGGAVIMATHDNDAMERAGTRIVLDEGRQISSK
jgi:putative ABC transport system ATP-binding protein